MNRVAIIGIGSYQYEDQLGWLVIDELNKKRSTARDIVLFKSKGNGLDWIDVVTDAEQVYFIDAVVSDQKYGFMHIFSIDSGFDQKESALGKSSHSVSFIDSVMIAHNIGLLALPVYFIGIEIGGGNNNNEIPIELMVKDIVSLIESRL